MPSALQKAKSDPQSTKARILEAARRIFGLYGFHGATTRQIAKEVGLDISTLYYHWGEKEDLYEAVIFDMAEDLRIQLRQVEKVIHGKPLARRMEISIDMMTSYLFEHPEISNLVLLRYFSRTRQEMAWDDRVPEFVTDIAHSMGLKEADGSVSPAVQMRVLTIMNSIYNFVSGEDFFRPMVGLDREAYIRMAKETLQFILIPAFAGRDGKTE